jgi:hypothetical protein
VSDYDDLVFGCDSAAGQEDKLVEILGDDAMGYRRFSRSSPPPGAPPAVDEPEQQHHRRRHHRRQNQDQNQDMSAPGWRGNATSASTTPTTTTYPQIPAGWPPPPYPAPPEWPASVPYPPPGAFPGVTAPTQYTTPPTQYGTQYSTTLQPGMYQPYPGAQPVPLPPGMIQAYPGAPLTPGTPPAPSGPQPTVDVFVGACLRRGVPAAAIVGCLRKRGYTGKQISDSMGRCL